MQIHISPRHRRTIFLSLLSTACVLGAFFFGVRSNSEFTAELTAAEDVARGDINGDGQMDMYDAIEVLEIVQGYQTVSPTARRSDPDGNGHLTVDDAIRILRQQ